MNILGSSAGTWAGTSGFRLMPTDALVVRPAAARLELGAGGHLTSLRYTWEHPADGPQDGLLLVWSVEAGSASAVWGDSWHQPGAPMAMSGQASDTSIELEGEYGEIWRWRIAVDVTSTRQLRMLMFNVVPAEHATPEFAGGPYVVAEAELIRS